MQSCSSGDLIVLPKGEQNQLVVKRTQEVGEGPSNRTGRVQKTGETESGIRVELKERIKMEWLCGVGRQ